MKRENYNPPPENEPKRPNPPPPPPKKNVIQVIVIGAVGRPFNRKQTVDQIFRQTEQ